MSLCNVVTPDILFFNFADTSTYKHQSQTSSLQFSSDTEIVLSATCAGDDLFESLNESVSCESLEVMY